jgi:hypothetical protein
MDTVAQAKTFFEVAKKLTRDALLEAVKLLPEEVQKTFWKIRRASFFDPKNEAEGSRKEILSPSGKYKLVTAGFTTGKGSWNYTQGVVYRKDDDKPIATVQRNYSRFPHLFIENHPKGDFLVCGEDYQGQTVVDLTSGTRRDLMSDGSDKGWGFCWSSYTYSAPNQILIVDGCFWGAPYEYRFHDFSDPMSGWPQIETEEHVDADEKKEPELDPDGTLRCYQTRYVEDEDHEDDSDEEKAKVPPEPIVDVLRTYKRDGMKFKLIEEFVSDYEKDRRRRNVEAEARFQAWKENFKATDPLYLVYAEMVKDPALSPEEHMGIGQTYETWSKGSNWAGQEKRWCRRIITHKGKTGSTVDLEWAVDTGPIKLVFYRDGASAGHTFFEHSGEGMKQAFAAAKEFANV